MADKLNFDKTKMLGFDKKGEPLFGNVAAEKDNKAVAGAVLSGEIKAAGIIKPAGISKATGTSKIRSGGNTTE